MYYKGNAAVAYRRTLSFFHGTSSYNLMVSEKSSSKCCGYAAIPLSHQTRFKFYAEPSGTAYRRARSALQYSTVCQPSPEPWQLSFSMSTTVSEPATVNSPQSLPRHSLPLEHLLRSYHERSILTVSTRFAKAARI